VIEGNARFSYRKSYNASAEHIVQILPNLFQGDKHCRKETNLYSIHCTLCYRYFKALDLEFELAVTLKNPKCHHDALVREVM
jgi:hypothetical protein